MTAASGVVYRAVAADGTVLYVGMSTQLARRLSAHARRSAWWPLHDRIEQDEPLPLDQAFISEADQITLLRPQFNRAGGCVDRFGPDQSTEREWLEWKVRYEAGETIEEIALEVGARPGRVRKHLIAVGTAMRRPGQRVGIVHRNRAKPAASAMSDAVVHVAFAGVRGVHRRRGLKRRAA